MSSRSVTLWSGHKGSICSNDLTKITVTSAGSVCCMCYPVTVRRRIVADQLMHCLVAGSGTGRGGGPGPPAPARQSVLHRAPGQVGSGHHDLLQVCAQLALVFANWLYVFIYLYVGSCGQGFINAIISQKIAFVFWCTYLLPLQYEKDK